MGAHTQLQRRDRKRAEGRLHRRGEKHALGAGLLLPRLHVLPLGNHLRRSAHYRPCARPHLGQGWRRKRPHRGTTDHTRLRQLYLSGSGAGCIHAPRKVAERSAGLRACHLRFGASILGQDETLLGKPRLQPCRRADPLGRGIHRQQASPRLAAHGWPRTGIRHQRWREQRRQLGKDMG